MSEPKYKTAEELPQPVDWNHPFAAHCKVVDAEAGLVETHPKRTKVCIVGYAMGSRHLAWYDDPDCEIWGVNQLYRFIPRADRWFQIHADDWKDPKHWPPGIDLVQWMHDCPIPIYMSRVDPDVPSAVRYPLDRLMQKGFPDYFTSTIAFMLALAIEEGFQEIGIYGIDLIVGEEYFYQKACAEMWIGWALGLGRNVHIPTGAALLRQSHRYGYENEPDYGFLNLSRLAARIDELTKKRARYQEQLTLQDGALQELEKWRDKAEAVHRDCAAKRVEELKGNCSVLRDHVYMLDGALQEVQRWHGVLELKMRGGAVG